MTKKIFILITIALFFVSKTAAQAAYVVGTDLLKYCQSEKTENIYSCINYVAGVIDYHVMLQSLGTAPTTDFCLPDSVTPQKAAVVVMRYLEKSPQHGSFIAAPAVIMAMHDAYPCTKSTTRKKKKK